MKLLILNGSSCSGKSTIIKEIMKRKKDFFHLSSDSLKWSFSVYTADTHYKDVRKLVLAVADSVFKMKYNVVSDSTLYKSSREKLIALAHKTGYEILEVNLMADFEILEKRFNERLAGVVVNSGKRISNTSKERFRELVDIFEKEKNPSAITFRTDTRSIEDVSEEIIKLL